jgi:hypothetical protein
MLGNGIVNLTNTTMKWQLRNKNETTFVLGLIDDRRNANRLSQAANLSFITSLVG